MALTHSRHNQLLEAITDAEKNRLFPHLERIPLEPGDVLYETNERQHYAFLPTDAIVSPLYVTENGSSTEIAMVGNEGMIGLALLTGDGTMPNRAVVQNPGYAFRIKGSLIRYEFAREERCCECYEAVRRETERVLRSPLPAGGREAHISARAVAR